MGEQRSATFDFAATQGASFQMSYGWELAGSYGNIPAEFNAAKDAVGIHDSSYVGRVRATGEDVLDLLNRLSTNEVVSLQPGAGAPTVLTDERGRIIDLVTVFNLGEHILLITGPEAKDKVIQWLDKYTIVDDVTLQDTTTSTAMFSMLGPQAGPALSRYAGVDLDSLEQYHSIHVTPDGTDIQILRNDIGTISRYEVVVAVESAEMVWKGLIECGAKPIGLAAYEMVRVEAGLPGSNKELCETYNPLETGLWDCISFTKGCYIGQEVIARLDTYQKVQRHLVTLKFTEDAQVAEGATLYENEVQVGTVTSVVTLPTTDEMIGMGYVKKGSSETGTELQLKGSKTSLATVGGPALSSQQVS